MEPVVLLALPSLSLLPPSVELLSSYQAYCTAEFSLQMGLVHLGRKHNHSLTVSSLFVVGTG